MSIAINVWDPPIEIARLARVSTFCSTGQYVFRKNAQQEVTSMSKRLNVVNAISLVLPAKAMLSIASPVWKTTPLTMPSNV